MVLRVLDIETSGMDPKEHAIIEIASVDLQSGGKIANMQSHLVKPNRSIPPESSAVHHLIGDDLVHARPLADVIGLYAGADAYVAHNCAFERAFLDQHFGSKPWLCTYKIALRVWPDAPAHNNQTLRYWRGHISPFAIPRAQIAPHRAISDVLVTAAILNDLMDAVGRDATGWAQMLAWSAAPPLITVCKFGTKHKGKRYDAIAVEDPSYLTWIIDKSDLDADTKWNARYWLDQAAAKKAG